MNRFLKPRVHFSNNHDPSPLNPEEHIYVLYQCIDIFFKQRHNKVPIIGDTTSSELCIQDAAYHLVHLMTTPVEEQPIYLSRIARFILNMHLNPKYSQHIGQGIEKAKKELSEKEASQN